MVFSCPESRRRYYYSNYDDLRTISKCTQENIRYKKTYKGIFHFLKFSESNYSSDYIGWKLHINTKKERVPEVYNIIYPYLKKHKLPFKVVTEKILSKKRNHPHRYIDYAQFTIYLQKSGKTRIEPKQLYILLRTFNSQFEKHKIPATTERVHSDAATKFAHFSLRNDCIDVPHQLLCQQIMEVIEKITRLNRSYIESKIVGKAYNPVNMQNPYKNILKSSNYYAQPLVVRLFSKQTTAIFNPIKHFEDFDVNAQKVRDKAFDNKFMVAVICTLWATTKYYHMKYKRKGSSTNSDNKWRIEMKYRYKDIENISELALKMLYTIKNNNSITSDIFTEAIDVISAISHEPANNSLLPIADKEQLYKNFHEFLRKALDLFCTRHTELRYRNACYLLPLNFQ